MASLGDLVISISGDIANLSAAMSRAEQETARTGKAIEGAMQRAQDSIVGLGEKLAAGVSVAGFAELIAGAVEAAEKLEHLSQATTLTVGQLSGLKFAAATVGMSLDSTTAAIEKLASGMGKNAEMFAQLGVNAKDPLKALEQLADAFKAIDDPQLRAAVGLQALGRGWKETAPLLAQGGQAIDDLVKQGEALSHMTDSIAQGAEELGKKWEMVKGNGGALNQLLTEMIPLLNATADGILRVTQGSSVLSPLWTVIIYALQDVVIVAGNVAFVFNAVGTSIGGIGAQLAALATGDFKRFNDIQQMLIEDGHANRVAFDAWEKSILAVGTAAGKTAAALRDMGDQASRRQAQEAAAAARAFLEFQARQAAAEAAAKAAAAEAARLLKLDTAGWIAHAQAVFDAADQENREIAKINEEFWKNEDRLRGLDNAGWVKYIDAKTEAYEKGLKEIGDLEPSHIEAMEKLLEKSYRETLDMLQSGFKTVWDAIVEGGGNTAQKIRDAFKRTLFDWLYQIAAKPIFLQIIGSLSLGGLSTAANAANGVSTLGGVGSGFNFLSGASDFFSGVGTSISNGIGVVTDTIAEGGATLAGAFGASASAATAFGQAIIGAIPVIGQIIAVGALLYSLFGKSGGGPKSGGSSYGSYGATGAFMSSLSVPGSDNGRFYTPGDQDSVVKGLADATASSIAQALASFGITGQNFGVGFGFDTDPHGTAGNRTSAMLTNSAGAVLYQNINQGASDIQGSLGLESQRVTLAAIQASAGTLPAYVADILKSVVAATATSDQITGVIAKAEEAYAVIQGLSALNVKGLDITALTAMQQSGETLSQTFQRVSGEWTSFNNAFESGAAKLGDAQTAVTDAFSKLGIAVPASKQEFYDLVHGLDLSTQAGRDMFDALMKVAPAFQTVTDAVAAAIGSFASIASQLSPSFAAGNAQGNLQSALSTWWGFDTANAGTSFQTALQQLAALQSGGFQGAQQYALGLGGGNNAAALSALTAVLAAYQAYEQSLGQGTTATNGATSAISNLGKVASSAAGGLSQLWGIKDSIADWLSKTLLSPTLSNLNPQEQLNFAQEQYVETLAAAQAGDLTALSNYSSVADAYLQAARAYYGSGGDYNSIFAGVAGQAGSLAGLADARPVSAGDAKANNQALIDAIHWLGGEVKSSTHKNADAHLKLLQLLKYSISDGALTVGAR